jgi:hypothetical protein
MRSILRSTLLASFALGMTLVFSGCEDTTKPTTTPPATTGDTAKDKMEPAAKDKMEPAPTPAPEKTEPPK